MKKTISKSIVIPVFNEEEMVPLIYAELISFLDDDDEIVFVNDGSTDSTAQVVKKKISKDARVKLITFSRNFGHQAAVVAGLQYSKGDVVIVMDCDMQDPPGLIPKLIEKYEEGFDVVHCVRRKRKETWVKRSLYKIFYWVYCQLSDFPSQRDSGDFSLMSRRVVKEINKMKEYGKFVRGLRTFVGFKQTTLKYERHARHKGQSKYNFHRLIMLAFDGIFSFSTFPLRLMVFFGFALLAISFLLILIFIYMKLAYEVVVGHTLTYVLVLFFGGINLFCFGIVGEYIGRIFYETKGRPFFIIESIENIDGKREDI